MRLLSCPGCRRHVRPRSGTCPFCESILPAPPGGAVFTGVVALAIAGCSVVAPQELTPLYGAPAMPSVPVVASPSPTPTATPSPEHWN